MNTMPILKADEKLVSRRAFTLRRSSDPQLHRPTLSLELNQTLSSRVISSSPPSLSPGLSPILLVRDQSPRVVVLDGFDGECLPAVLKKQPLPQNEALKILRGAAVALDSLHRAQKVHGAMGPHSILVGAKNEVRVFDWMIGWNNVPAELLSDAAEYLPPERLSNRATGAQADQFALGIIAHQLLLRRTPFPAAGLAEKLFRIRHGLWDDGVMGEIGLSVYRVYDRVFSVKPEDRFESCLTFVEELETASKQRVYTETKLVSVQPSASSPTRLSDGARQAPHSRSESRSRLKIWWAAASIAALLAFVLGVFDWRLQHQVDELDNQSEAVGVTAPAAADISSNGVFNVCNSSPTPIDIRELAVAYWGKDHRLQVFNSTHYSEQGWQVAPSSSQLLSWPLGQKSVWDGSVLFYFARIRQEQKEYVVSGRWDQSAQSCLPFSF